MNIRIIALLILLLSASIAHSEVAVRVQRVQYAFPGDPVEVAITLTDISGLFETGGFELTVIQDSNLTLTNVSPGGFITDCEWEYFNYGQISSLEWNISGLADMNNGSHHPTCWGNSTAELAVLTYTTPLNLNLIGKFLTVRFKWYDCGDNAVSSKMGDRLFVSRDVYHYDGQLEYLITRDTTFPSLFGAPSGCVPNDTGAHVIDFYNGGISYSNQDVTPPVAICPGDMTLPAAPGLCGANVYWQAAVTDNRPGATVFCWPPPGTFFPVGSNSVRCIAQDAAGNRDTCWFTVAVTDIEPPTISCPADTTVQCGPGQCATVVTFQISATDECSAVDIVTSKSSGATFNIGTTVVQAIAVDSYGNADTCTFNVTVEDNQPPISACQNDTTLANDPGTCGAAFSFDLSGTDNCYFVAMSSSPTSGIVFPIGATPVAVVATDWSGLADTCIFTVTVIDTEPPVLTIPQSFAVANDPGLCGAVVGFDVEATDNCGIAELAVSSDSGSLFPIGTTGVAVLATDSSGNSTFETFSITVIDTEPPRLTLPDTLTFDNDPGACGAVIDYSVIVQDNCGDPVVTASLASGSFQPPGVYTVNVSATDGAGLSDSGSFVVEVQDTEPPSVVCPDNFQVLTDSGAYTATVAYSISADDNCGIEFVNTEPASGSVLAVGSTNVSTTAVDSAGNETQCSFTITVELDDADHDGIATWEDNCPTTPNPEQADANLDGLGDACCCRLRGNVDGGPEAVNITDLTFLVSHLMAGGAPPPCPEEANVDGIYGPGGPSDVADITFMVAFLFGGGGLPPPCN